MTTKTCVAIAGLILLSAVPAAAQGARPRGGVDNLGSGGASDLGRDGVSQLGTSGVENLPCTGTTVCGSEGLASPPTVEPLILPPPPVPVERPVRPPRPLILSPDDALIQRR